jgi:hypothetical protein
MAAGQVICGSFSSGMMSVIPLKSFVTSVKAAGTVK